MKSSMSSNNSNNNSPKKNSNHQHQQRSPRQGQQEILYGIVISIRDTFGFIQPICGQTEDNIFFSLKDAYRDMKIGDEICFVTRNTNRGPQAEELHLVEDNKVMIENIKGIIIREPRASNDIGKPGEIQIITNSSNENLPKTATFFS